VSPDLASLQRDFMARLYDDAPAGDPRVQIYRHNLRANLGAALAATFPVVQRLVGDVFFAAAAERFVHASPSTSGDLHAYGERFPDFLDADPHAQALAYLGDVARLEWARAQAFHAPDARPFDFEALTSLDESKRARIRLHLHASVQVIDSAWPVLSIWEANQAPRDGSVDGAWAPQVVLVHREGTLVHSRAIERDEASFLQALARGAPLEQAMDVLCEPASLDGRLLEAIRRGVIERFSAA
jgi:hypothetical protein